MIKLKAPPFDQIDFTAPEPKAETNRVRIKYVIDCEILREAAWQAWCSQSNWDAERMRPARDYLIELVPGNKQGDNKALSVPEWMTMLAEVAAAMNAGRKISIRDACKKSGNTYSVLMDYKNHKRPREWAHINAHMKALKAAGVSPTGHVKRHKIWTEGSRKERRRAFGNGP